MARAFTTKYVEALKPDPVKRLELPDPALSGLYLIVQPSGAKSWAFRFRFAGKPKKLTLGKWPVMTIADARAACSKAVEEVEHGKDPSEAKKRTKAARLEAHLSQRDRVKTLIEQYAFRHLSTLKSGATVKRELDRHVVSVWGERDVRDIARRDVVDLLDEISGTGRKVTANRVRAYLNKFFGWCVEREIVHASPMAGVKPVSIERSRDRVLNDDEIKWFWLACNDLGQPWGHLGKLLLLTGQRLGEVVGMNEDEVRGDTWHLASERTKNGRAHDVPLSDNVQDVLAGLVRIKSDAGLLFTTTGETPLSGFNKGRRYLADRMVEIASREIGQPVEIPHWTFHDLRRTAATGMARLGIPVRVTEAVLNHVSGTGGGIVGVYQRHDYADEKRRALEAWGEKAEMIAVGKPDNVVHFSHQS
ncbi:MAG: site-specific integrase [Pseudomonadota bacterium]